jgi:hypothetical protein
MRLIHLITDEGQAGWADLAGRLGRALPEAEICPVPVRPRDTLAAGFCLAELALADGPVARMVFDAVTPDDDDGVAFWLGRSPGGVLAVAPAAGWSWSYAAGHLRTLCRLDVPAGRRSHARLASAAVHAARRHPHAVAGVVARREVPGLPGRALPAAELAPALVGARRVLERR